MCLRGRWELLKPEVVLLVQNEPVKNSQDLFAVSIDALQVVPERGFKIVRLHPLVEQVAGDVDILPQRFRGMAAKKKAVEKCSLPLRC